jgi:type IV pilus assembly protein PilW
LGGSGGTANVFPATPDSDSNVFAVENSNGILPSDYLLMTDSATVGSDCYLFKVSPNFTLAFANGFLDDTPKAIPLDTRFMVNGSLATISGKASLLNLGVAPKFYMIGVDTETMALSLYDLMQNRNTTGEDMAVRLGENVFLLRVLYGVVDPAVGGLTWKSPAASGWTFSDLQEGTEAANERLSQIRALRIALVMRATYPSNDPSPVSIRLFSSLEDSLQQTITLTNEERRYRYQVYETVVPLFNI